jgi:exodeoxyribonuclease VII small subunit
MKNNMKFEEAIALLEEITAKLENGGYSLDESLSAFEEAVKLVKFCNLKLEKAEQKVKILTESSDGTITDSDFTAEKYEN